VHEFMTLDGVIDAPTWTFEHGFEPQMGATIGAVTLTRGSGPRLFPDGAAPLDLSLSASESYENGVVYLSYRPAA